jgi:hypothetical protein
MDCKFYGKREGAKFEILPRHFVGVTKEKHVKFQS